MAERSTESPLARRLPVDTPADSQAAPVVGAVPRRAVGRVGRALDYATLLVPLFLQCALLVIVILQFAALQRAPERAAAGDATGKSSTDLEYLKTLANDREDMKKLLGDQAALNEALVKQLVNLRGTGKDRKNDDEVATALAAFTEALKKLPAPQVKLEVGNELSAIAGHLAKIKDALPARRAEPDEDWFVLYYGNEPACVEFYAAAAARITDDLKRYGRGNVKNFKPTNDDQAVRSFLEAAEGPKRGPWRCLLLTDVKAKALDGNFKADASLAALTIVLLQPDPNADAAKPAAAWLDFCGRQGATLAPVRLQLKNRDETIERIVKRLAGMSAR